MWLLSASSVVCLCFALQEIWVRHPACHFFPLPLLTWLWLAARDNMVRAVWVPQNPSAFKWLVVGHLLLALVSFLLVSPFLAGLACFITSMALAVGRGNPADNEAPAWSLPLLSLFFIPPPMMLDQNVHQMLAGLAARLSQGWLDAMQVLHVVQGTIVATPAKRFFVDDACSGTNTLMVAVCVALIVSSFNNRSLLHGAALFVTAGLLSVASNVLRICLVIGSSHFWGWELDHGMVHEAVGVVFFLLDLLLIWSADRGLHFLFNSSSHHRAVPSKGTVPEVRSVGTRLFSHLSVCVAVIGTMLLLGPAILALGHPGTAALTTKDLTSMGEIQMPAQLSGWVREGDRPVEDSMIGKVGVRNQVWLYRKGGQQAFVAVNFPFKGFHDTRLCYTGQGWQFQQQVDTALPGEQANTVRFLAMSQPTEMTRANLWLSVLDEHGSAQPFISEEHLERMTDRLLSRWTKPAPVSTTYVLQIMALEPESELSAQNAFNELLAGARNCLAEAISNHNSDARKESE